MLELSVLNLSSTPPKKDDLLVIETRKSIGKKVAVQAKNIINVGDGIEVIVSTSKNKFFNWDMYMKGESWVWRVWNLGQITLTSSTNNMVDLGRL